MATTSSKAADVLKAASMLEPGNKTSKDIAQSKKGFDNLKNLLKNQKSQSGDDLHNHV